MKVYVLHENPEWYVPLAAAFDQAGLPHEQWLLGDSVVDLDAEPPAGVYWSRMSASSHTRGHPFAKDQTRGVLTWLESRGRRVVNGRRVLDLEVSKVEQLGRIGVDGLECRFVGSTIGRVPDAIAARPELIGGDQVHNGGQVGGCRPPQQHLHRRGQDSQDLHAVSVSQRGNSGQIGR